MTYEVDVSFKSGSKMGPLVSARRRVMRSERPLRSTLPWAETRDTESISRIYISRKKAKSGTRQTGGNKMPIGRETAGKERVNG